MLDTVPFRLPKHHGQIITLSEWMNEWMEKAHFLLSSYSHYASTVVWFGQP